MASVYTYGKVGCRGLRTGPEKIWGETESAGQKTTYFSQKLSHIWFPRHVQMLVHVVPPDVRPIKCIFGSGRHTQCYILSLTLWV